MLSHSVAAARALAVLACASLALAGCGIKGPLKLPPKPEPATSEAPATKPAPRSP
jgi:predicted small lipoprotein YifL